MKIQTLYLSVPLTLLLAISASGCATGKAAAPAPSSGEVTAPTEHAEHHAQMTPPSTEDATGAGEDSMAMKCTMNECPMHAPEVQITIEDVAGGAALHFAVPSDGGDDLKSRVTWLAERHNAHHEVASDQPQGEADGGQMARMPASHAEVVSEGATTTLIVRATDPANLDELRRHMHHHAEMMQEGQCPMMATGHGEAEKSPEEAKKEFWEPLTDLWPSIPMGF